MALILKAKTNRKGALKGFDVVAVADADDRVRDTLEGVAEGEYKIHTDEGKLVTAQVGYRTVQDIVLS